MASSRTILVINCGSSSLKFQVCAVPADGAEPVAVQVRGGGRVTGIGAQGPARFTARAGIDAARDDAVRVGSQADAVGLALDWLRDSGLLVGADGLPDGVGHRVVHGGTHFRRPTRIDRAVLDALEALRDLAPLHNGPSLAGIAAVREALGEEVPNVAVFDTAFHRTLPAHARHYALPAELTRRHGIERFGFHGTSCRSVLHAYARLTSTPPRATSAVILHLGAGASATAVQNGRSVDTSMGLTPLEGLMMNTRSGDVDPALVAFLARKEGLAPDEVERLLNTEAGLRGVSESRRELADLMAAEDDDPAARQAVAMYCHRVRKYVGAYLGVLGGAQAVLFTGGIGEHVPALRERVCAGFGWAGLHLDPARNNEAGTEGARRISRDDATLHAYVIPSDEERMIALDTAMTLAGRDPAV